ncbi:MAG TPA: Xaa-Pro peptidase family protein [Candidatus Methanoculleus thermohydrogenotrophicum]|jgi:Xaa-Pro aminopeptidase|nr:Xaa-Pro peptidase family protein [Candidatus Methanoculleus thermohydrogenotrophicum]NLM81068.1 aminopeptidase P family protein [Candidatus Methanoculleus thermohydrogenotrophicum]HOB18409.1 Xaa-Pro peptidase family protein [Candidatus Methanoculleus thermohydrogenotrophicum]HPZ38338.1 Xaa-Pro peptidase family protein [Candidatus Methanoculleus thermohydrogenotrophicum]HQC91706.1 Xaa-Pro peptidase family protein [Candidatus Methanoculleus thermohydrogenotrophicum]
MNGLDSAIQNAGAAAYVAYGSSADADVRYLTRFRTNDPVVYVKRPGERGILIIPQMEHERAVRESSAAVITRADAGYLEHIKAGEPRWRATAHMIADLAAGPVLVPATFPLALARELESFHPVILDAAGTVGEMRAVKTPEEIEQMRSVQRATEAAMEHGVALIRGSVPKGGILHRDGQPLTAEAVRTEMHIFLLTRGCRGIDTIVSCGPDTALPHNLGAGPLLESEPIVIDVFPQDELSGYHADMTRTVVKGEPSTEVREMYEAVQDAKALGTSMVRAGAVGADIYQAVVEFFRERGYESNTRGFIHSLGHGVGLEVHEEPSLGPRGGALAAGNVVTIEPGLYYPGIGGVRLEDMGAVTETGFDRFTQYTEELII